MSKCNRNARPFRPVVYRPTEAQTLINRLTNWQRNQWARAGYPRDAANIEPFLALTRIQA